LILIKHYEKSNNASDTKKRLAKASLHYVYFPNKCFPDEPFPTMKLSRLIHGKKNLSRREPFLTIKKGRSLETYNFPEYKGESYLFNFKSINFKSISKRSEPKVTNQNKTKLDRDSIYLYDKV
jgi:hypothetical protein